MTVLDPTDLSSPEAFEQVVAAFGIHVFQKSVPPSWKPWTLPTSPLPIDNFIASIVKRERSPRVRPRDALLKFDFGGCPYAIARHGVVSAFFHASAHRELDELRAVSTAKMRALKDELPSLRTDLLKSIGNIAAIGTAQEQFQEVNFAAFRTLQEGLLAALSAIDSTGQEISDLFLSRSQNQGNIWRIRFAGALFRTWWQLTDQDPSPSGLFIDFANSAWNSLSSADLPEVSWESAVRTARRQSSDNGWRN